eukprot:ANDGO_06245.mRNA.1 Steroid 5-alpha-reductase DET2
MAEPFFLLCCTTVSIVYYALCGFAAILIVSSFVVQFGKPANYGKFATAAETAGRSSQIEIPQRLAHILSDFPPGALLTPALFVGLVVQSGQVDVPAIVLVGYYVAHYLHRGLVHPLTMRYSAKTTPLGICIGGMIPNYTFSAGFALHLASTDYGNSYFYSPCFILGSLLFVIGYVINRWADYSLRELRKAAATSDPKSQPESESQALTPRSATYKVPHAGLFRLVTNPNYFGELVEWIGYAIATASLIGVLWALFGLSTFLPRSLATRRWYLRTFPGEFPPSRKALIPFLI